MVRTLQSDDAGLQPQVGSPVGVPLQFADLGRLHGKAVVVLDNLHEDALTPAIYDPTLNPLYRDVLQNYGAVALLWALKSKNF